MRRRLARPRPFSPDLARRFAKQTARYLGSLSVEHRCEHDIHDGRVSSEPRWPGVRWELVPAIEVVSFLEADDSASKFAGDRPSAARRFMNDLASYLLVGTGQSLGVLTPDEARQGVASLTGSDELVAQAGELAARCDLILYGDLTGEPAMELRELIDDARRLFEALGRVRSSRAAASVVSAWPGRGTVWPRC